GILEHAEIANLSGDVLNVRQSVAALDADEDKQTGPNLPNAAIANGHASRGDTLDDRSHAGAGTFARSSAGGFNLVSSRCRGATLPSAFSIDCFTPGCSRSSSISRRLARCRCRPRSPHAGQQQPMIGSSDSLQYARASSSPTYTSGRITTCSSLSDTSLAGIAFSDPAKNRLSSSVSMKSSAWCPSAIFVAPTSVAMRYSTPRRNRAHSEHGVASASSISSMSSPMPVCSMRYSHPRASHVFAIRSCLYSLYPESTLTATSEKRIGARCRSTSSNCSSAQLSLPPDRPTMTRSPSSIIW